MHTWEIKCYHPFQLLPLSVWKMCAGGSQQCEITPLGGQKKRQSAKDCHLNFHSMSPHLSWVYCTAQTQLTEISSFFFLVHYKLLLLMLFFVVILRNNLVAFGIVLPRILLHAFSSTNNLAGSGNSSLCNFVLCTFFFYFCRKQDNHVLTDYFLFVRTEFFFLLCAHYYTKLFWKIWK